MSGELQGSEGAGMGSHGVQGPAGCKGEGSLLEVHLRVQWCECGILWCEGVLGCEGGVLWSDVVTTSIA